MKIFTKIVFMLFINWCMISFILWALRQPSDFFFACGLFITLLAVYINHILIKYLFNQNKKSK